MGTKANPAPHDCYAAALPDEPLFVLLGRDPLAPGLTRLWAAIRSADRDLIFAAVSELQGFVPLYAETPDEEKAEEAFAASEAMRTWRSLNMGAWRETPALEGAAS